MKAKVVAPETPRSLRSASRPILIAGGGIGGLATALALARVGQRVQVLERSVETSGAGAGIQLGPNAVKVLRLLEIDEAVRAVASVPEALVMRRGSDGRILTRLPLGAAIEQRHGAPYWVVHRADLSQVLWQAAQVHPGIDVVSAWEVAGVAVTAGGVDVTARDGRAVSGRALIGADGLWSRVRAGVVAGASPELSRYCAYRTLLPTHTAGLLAIPLATPDTGAWLSPDAHIVHYPVRAGAAINVVVITRLKGSGPVGDHPWSAPATAADVAAATLSFLPELQRCLANAAQWHTWALAEPLVLPRWTAGPVALVGDAAHAMLPFFAQGGAMALEDAAVLAACVAAAPGDCPGAFAAYAARRRARVGQVQAASSSNGRIFHLSGAAALARDGALRLLPPSVLQQRFDWLYGFNCLE